MSAQISTNLKVAPSAVKPLQPSRSRSGNIDATQSQLSASITGTASQRITDAAYYNEYYYLLENLATIRSVVLAVDVTDGDEIVTSFFEGFVDIVRCAYSRCDLAEVSAVQLQADMQIRYEQEPDTAHV